MVVQLLLFELFHEGGAVQRQELGSPVLDTLGLL